MLHKCSGVRGGGGKLLTIKGELEIKYPVQFLTATGSDLKHIHGGSCIYP